MNRFITSEISELISVPHYQPAISIFMPFEPKMNSKSEIGYQLKRIVENVERDISENYPANMAKLVIGKMERIIRNLNFNTYKKSIAIFASPIFEKVLYLDIPVEERFIIDDSFEIRDLVLAKKETPNYLVIVLSGRCSKVYMGNGSGLIRIKHDTPESMKYYENDIAERGSNFSDPDARKEILLGKFLRYTDNGIKQALNIYPLPLFVMGPKKILGYFRDITRNAQAIVDYIPGNFEALSNQELLQHLGPRVNNWRKVMKKHILKQMEKAASAGRLSTGIEEVWKNSSMGKGKLLLVEEDFICPALNLGNGNIEGLPADYNSFSYIKDTVDDIIEKVLENGGDVEFMENGILEGQGRIALIHYF